MRNLSPFAKKIIISLIAFAIGVSVWCLIFFLRQQFSIDAASDAFFFAGMVTLAGIAYIFIRRWGAFDILEYSFYRLGESFRPGMPKRYETAYDFTVARKEKRQKKKPFFWPFLIVGGTFLIAALILMSIFEVNVPR